MQIDKTDFENLMRNVVFSQYNRKLIIKQFNKFLDSYENDNKDKPFPEVDNILIEKLKDYGLYINCFGKVLRIYEHNVKVLMLLIEYKRFDILYDLLDNHEYKSVVDDFHDKTLVNHEMHLITWYKRPLLMAYYSGNTELMLKLINYGAYSISIMNNIIDILINDKNYKLIDLIIDNCKLHDDLLEDLSKKTKKIYKEIYGKYMEINKA